MVWVMVSSYDVFFMTIFEENFNLKTLKTWKILKFYRKFKKRFKILLKNLKSTNSNSIPAYGHQKSRAIATLYMPFAQKRIKIEFLRWCYFCAILISLCILFFGTVKTSATFLHSDWVMLCLGLLNVNQIACLLVKNLSWFYMVN